MNHRLNLFILLVLPYSLLGQYQISGTVLDRHNSPIFAANVYPQSKPELGTTTDFEGQFSISLDHFDHEDSLICSFIGYEQVVIPFRETKGSLQIILVDQQLEIEEITVLGKNPISEQFSVQKLERLDVYLNPVANADPLKAISFTAASTNTDESANINLRGSAADQSRVLLNGVPIYRPVRNSQINGTGFFSLFNTEMLDQLFVYAGNPPLTYGNSSAGLVEIQTRKEIQDNQIQISTGLASIGTFIQQKLHDKHHLRIYGNLQFSEPFIQLNRGNIVDLQSFSNQDAGIQYFSQINPDLSFQFFTYGINESVSAIGNIFTYEGLAKAQKQRNFNVASLDYQKDNTSLSIKHGSNFTKSKYSFGNIQNHSNNQNWYHSINFKQRFNSWNIQTGITHDFNQFHFQDSIPLVYYAFTEESPTTFGDSLMNLQQLEWYAYGTWNVNSQWMISAGFRTNVPIHQQKKYNSFQLGLNYAPNFKNRFLLGFGQYHSYNLPNFYGQKFNLIRSRQVALDYDFEDDNWKLHTAFFYKEEQGERVLNNSQSISQNKILGLEFNLQYFLGKYWRLEASNIFIQEQILQNEQWQRGNQSLPYFLKAAIQFDHPKWFNFAIVYMTRPGRFYTSINDQFYDNNLDIFGPIFNEIINDQQFEDYHRIDISISKRLLLNHSIRSIILYASVNNLLNFENQRAVKYLDNFLQESFNHYQLRTIYFGSVFEF